MTPTERDHLDTSRRLLRCLEVMLPELAEDADERDAALTLIHAIDARLADLVAGGVEAG